jgi:ammonia channel protein AmtB
LHVDAGNTAFLLLCTMLVLFMTPGLALFYGGMVRSKHVLAMLAQNFAVIAVISIVWALIGYSLGVAVAASWAFVLTGIIALAVHRTIGLRVTPEDELAGLDMAVHAETAYEHGAFGAR